MGMPGCPDFAFSTASAASIRIVLAAREISWSVRVDAITSPLPRVARACRGGRGRFHGVAAELVPQRGHDLRGERLLLPGDEAGLQRKREDRRRDAPVDRLLDRPASFPRVLDVAADGLEA